MACSLRIPLEKELEYIAEVIKHPIEYMIPFYISIGHPAKDAVINEQKECNLADKIHINQW